MASKILGEHPLATDAEGHLKCRIGTVFPQHNTIVTLPGIHATQKLAFLNMFNAERVANGEALLTEAQELDFYQSAVDIIMEQQTVFIRPIPEAMDLAFKADEILQELISKQHIKFLHVLNPTVRAAVKQRGECWRINPLPHTPAAMKQMIRNSRTRIHGLDIYYYNMTTGTRFLTCEQFARLGELAPAELARQLQEISDFSGRKTSSGYPEVQFFQADASFGHAAFAGHDFTNADPARLAQVYQTLQRQFQSAVRPDFWSDNYEATDWRVVMFAALIGVQDEAVTEEMLLGLGSEFFMQIEWLPGARLENGELMFDQIFEEAGRNPCDLKLRALCDEKAKGFIFNYIREYGDIEYINIGRVATSLSKRPHMMSGRREVYIAELKPQNTEKPVLRIIRMQKWGISEHLDENKDLLQAIMEAEEYTNYILNRRLGCRQLGMHLPIRVTAHKISERYQGPITACQGQILWSTYFERDYLSGIASDKIPLAKFGDPDYALRFARLMGAAAACNLIVGRLDSERHVMFDDGDEVLIEDRAGLPAEIIVADHSGTFTDYLSPLTTFVTEFAKPLTKRYQYVSCWEGFANTYLEAFAWQFNVIQQEYRKRRRAFDALFKHERRDEQGSFAYRWEKVLERLDASESQLLMRLIREQLCF